MIKAWNNRKRRLIFESLPQLPPFVLITALHAWPSLEELHEAVTWNCFQPSGRSSQRCWALLGSLLFRPSLPNPSTVEAGSPDAALLLLRPHHHTSTSMLHSGNHACRNNQFIFSLSHKDTSGGTKDLKVGLIKPKRRLPLVHWVSLCPNNSLLLVVFPCY